MAKKEFSNKIKTKALRLMNEGAITQKQIAKKIGCSVAALSLWRRAYMDGQLGDEIVEDDESAEYESCETSHTKVSTAQKNRDAIHELKMKFWSEDFRAANMLLTPTGASPDEVVGLINEALEYAYRYCKK
ncbi:MAG: hypothetical protein LBI05_11455 [Planctomycetaceae bacterium]|jgi:transposase-like protein|nr:hypothetical protein [Planctomycetaceae bacterium]